MYANKYDAGPLAIQPVGPVNKNHPGKMKFLYGLLNRSTRLPVAPVPPSAIHCSRARMAALGEDSLFLPLSHWISENSFTDTEYKEMLCL